VYDRYCSQTKTKKYKIPVLKRVIKGLIAAYGKPTQVMINKLTEWED